MTKQITLEEALKLVSFCHSNHCGWQVHYVNGDVEGDVVGNVCGDVDGNILGDVNGIVFGEINGREWESVETPEKKLQRLIAESGNQELIDTFNQMEDN